MAEVDCLVIGAGAVGLAVARALAADGTGAMVLERRERAGEETSSRNSGVIHAGIYYPKSSLKARLCVAGKRLLYDYCADRGVDAVRCGKLLVATSENELARLDELAGNARGNGVDDLEPLDATAVRCLEPEIRCAGALLSPSTGVVDATGLVQALEGDLQRLGVELVANTRVESIAPSADGFDVDFDSLGERGRITCARLVLAAAHGAPALAAGLPVRDGYRVPGHYPARGHYYRVNGGPRFCHLVYPMPDGAWLGTHLTLDTAGTVRFGPDNEWIDALDYGFDDSPERRRRFTDEIRRYWPALEDDMLEPDYVGVRPKIYRRGDPVPDFAIHGPRDHGIAGLVALFGIESPGLTSCLAIGDFVRDLLLARDAA